MNELCLYNGRVCDVIYNFKYNDFDFSICLSEKKLVYFKRDTVNEKYVYTPYDRWVKAFEKDESVLGVKKLDQFINDLNKKNNYNINYIKRRVNRFLYPKTNRKKIKKKFLNQYFFVFMISIISLVVGGVTLFNWYNQGKRVDNIMTNVLENTKIEETVAFTSAEIPEITQDLNPTTTQKYGEDYWKYMQMTMISVDFDELLKINPDTVGWLYVNNTNVNYPFVQGEDNSYYLTHSFDKSYNVAGWLFADYKSNFKKFGNNTVIYGHGRVDQVMLGSLHNILDSSWYTNEDNQIIKLSTPFKNTLWKVFSIYTIPSESYYLTHTFENDESYQKFLDTMLSRSIYNFGVKVDSSDKILTISTCLDNNGNRIVVQAKKIKEQSR